MPRFMTIYYTLPSDDAGNTLGMHTIDRISELEHMADLRVRLSRQLDELHTFVDFSLHKFYLLVGAQGTRQCITFLDTTLPWMTVASNADDTHVLYFCTPKQIQSIMVADTTS